MIDLVCSKIECWYPTFLCNRCASMHQYRLSPPIAPSPQLPSLRRSLNPLRFDSASLLPSKPPNVVMSPSDKLSIVPLFENEIPVCAELLSRSFGHDAPFVDIYFPNHDTPSGQASVSSRLTAWQRSSLEDSVFLKAVIRSSKDNKDGIIAGFCIWTLMKEPPPAELAKVEKVDEVWPDKDDREFMTRLWSKYVIPRSEVIKRSAGKGVYVLELLAVDPDHQRLGAGTALVAWGTRYADELGIESVVEGTPVGRRCYENGGFHTEIEEMDFDTGEEFSGRRKPTLHFLTRQPNT
ncbi:unnamed protein product [Periconia digitata]|uniref:N-acetyltransferase domain-containing protein n=1 Tax=Periconia digitata TaxID=1303443 RepID=A0A9W4XSK8_9PLEO|nr:unnamed protein product [Periconia digitata]